MHEIYIDIFLKLVIEQKDILEKFIERFSKKDEPMQVKTETPNNEEDPKVKSPKPMQRDRWDEVDSKLKNYEKLEK